MLVMMPDVAWLNPPPLSATPLQEELIKVTCHSKVRGHLLLRQPGNDDLFDHWWHLQPAQSDSGAENLGKGAIRHHIPSVLRITPAMKTNEIILLTC